MTKEELIEQLNNLGELDGDKEVSHMKADSLLLRFIGDVDVDKAFDSVGKWYA